MISFFIQTEVVWHADGIILCDWITAVVKYTIGIKKKKEMKN